MLHKTKAIALHYFQYSENSIIAKVYTKEFGLQSYIINNVRSRKAKIKANLFQPFSLLDMVVYHKEKEGLQRIKEIKIDYPFSDIPFTISKSSIALFLSELLYTSIKEISSNKEMFHFIYSSITTLDSMKSNYANFHLLFMVKLSKYLGFHPHGTFSEKTFCFDLKEGIFQSITPNHPYFLTKEESRFLSAFLDMQYDTLNDQQPNKKHRRNLIVQLITYYKLHLEGIKDIKTHQILENVLN